MDLKTLESRGYAREFQGKVTAHPKIDPVSGDMTWFGYGVGPMPLSAGMSYGVTAADGSLVRRQDFEAPFACMVHDFMVTENYALFPILPLTASLERAMGGKPPFAWEPDKGSYVGVMRRDADVSTIRWFNAPACYVFHPLNSWRPTARSTVTSCVTMWRRCSPRPTARRGDKAAARLTRWTFDLNSNSDAIREEVLDDLDGEFPRVDPRVETRKHRHGWYAADPTSSKTIKQERHRPPRPQDGQAPGL